MKQFSILTAMLVFVPMAVAQEERERTEVRVTETTMPSDANLISELWLYDDTTTVPPGQVDLRLTGNWITSNFPANNGNSDDDVIFTPSLWFGLVEGVEAFVGVPVWFGDGGDAGAFDEGNGDVNVGFNVRFLDQGADFPVSMSLKNTLRAPTGDNSNGVDYEARLILSHEYDNGIRAHVNVFGKTVNSDNWKSAPIEVTPFRHFQYGVAVGFDGPLNGDGGLRWVLDYLHRSSLHQGRSNMNMIEAGWEWAIDGAQKLGMNILVGLDGSGDTPNLGAGIAYSHALTF